MVENFILIPLKVNIFKYFRANFFLNQLFIGYEYSIPYYDF